MNLLYQLTRLFVGVLFIFSGFVKLVDPLGFSYKLEEYFSGGVLNLEFLVPFALYLAVFIVIYELLIGVTLLVGYAPKFTLWSLLLMIIFFTFLTFYSAYFNKVTDCGCFGDAIPLDPWQSFYKDIILLVLILFLFINKQYLQPLFSKTIGFTLFFLAFLISTYVSYLGLNHLPIIDFRAYKVGTNILESMGIPDNAPKDIYNYHWKFKIDGTEKIITTQGNYPQVNGELLSYTTELVREGYTPPIHDFSMEKNGKDYTKHLMAKPKVLMVASYNLSKSNTQGWQNINLIIEEANVNNYQVIVLTSSAAKDQKVIHELLQKELDFYTTDETAIKTIIRSNPGIIKINNGVIKQKLHWHDALDISF